MTIDEAQTKRAFFPLTDEPRRLFRFRREKMAEWLDELESTCSALGVWDGVAYAKEEDCVECAKDLIRFLRRDDETHAIRRRLGEIHVVENDLVPLLRQHSGFDAEGQETNSKTKLKVRLSTHPVYKRL